jgi:quinol monooxygenase YgiN
MKVISEKRAELLQTLRSMTEEIRKEKGCMSCYFYQDVENENIFSLIETWKTQEELDIHLKSDMFSALIGIESLLIKPPEINIKAISYNAGMEAVKKAREESRTWSEKKKKNEEGLDRRGQ